MPGNSDLTGCPLQLLVVTFGLTQISLHIAYDEHYKSEPQAGQDQAPVSLRPLSESAKPWFFWGVLRIFFDNKNSDNTPQDSLRI